MCATEHGSCALLGLGKCARVLVLVALAVRSAPIAEATAMNGTRNIPRDATEPQSKSVGNAADLAGKRLYARSAQGVGSIAASNRASAYMAATVAQTSHDEASQPRLLQKHVPMCPIGYVDQTSGNANWWSCGKGCPGGWYTNDDCSCACVDPSPSTSTVTTTMRIRMTTVDPRTLTYGPARAGFSNPPGNPITTSPSPAIKAGSSAVFLQPHTTTQAMRVASAGDDGFDGYDKPGTADDWLPAVVVLALAVACTIIAFVTLVLYCSSTHWHAWVRRKSVEDPTIISVGVTHKSAKCASVHPLPVGDCNNSSSHHPLPLTCRTHYPQPTPTCWEQSGQTGAHLHDQQAITVKTFLGLATLPAPCPSATSTRAPSSASSNTSSRC